MVVGEFKKGKSSLINSLLGQAVCPVDDDIATAAVTVVQYGTEPSATVSIRRGDEETRESVNPANLAAYVTEERSQKDGTPTSAEVSLPSPFLERGIVLIDTPGIGGLNPGYMAVTLAYLRLADAAVFVTDASAPLSRYELEFLSRAHEYCPSVLVALTKTDLYPDWYMVLDRDIDAFEASGVEAPIYALSNALRNLAFEQTSRDLNADSGFPELTEGIEELVLTPAEHLAYQRASQDLDRCLAQVELATQSELQALNDPSGTDELVSQLSAARERLNQLRAGNSRWMTLLSDGFADLTGNVEHEFRLTIRTLQRDIEEGIEDSDPAKEWENTTAVLRDRVADAADRIVANLTDGATQVSKDIAELINDSQFDVELTQKPEGLGRVNGSLLRRAAAEAPSLGSRVGSGYTGLRGAQGGMLVLGMLGNLAGVALSTFALAGVGIVFGGKQLFDERGRQVAFRRQQARTELRQYLDDVQFHVSKDMRDLSRQLQRQIRDHFSSRLAEMTKTYSDAVESLQRSQRSSDAQRTERIAELTELLTETAQLRKAWGAAALA